MNSLWIDSLAERICQRERSISPLPPSHHNRYTSPAYTLKKRLDILGARLRVCKADSTYKSPLSPTPADTWWLIIEDYDMLLTDIYTRISYLHALDQYTFQVTHNRGYYCRKKSQTRLYLLNTYWLSPPQTYSMRDQARERFFSPLPSRPPLNTFLFNYLISLQDDKSNNN